MNRIAQKKVDWLVKEKDGVILLSDLAKVEVLVGESVAVIDEYGKVIWKDKKINTSP